MRCSTTDVIVVGTNGVITIGGRTSKSLDHQQRGTIPVEPIELVHRGEPDRSVESPRLRVPFIVVGRSDSEDLQEAAAICPEVLLDCSDEAAPDPDTAKVAPHGQECQLSSFGKVSINERDANRHAASSRDERLEPRRLLYVVGGSFLDAEPRRQGAKDPVHAFWIPESLNDDDHSPILTGISRAGGGSSCGGRPHEVPWRAAEL